MLDAPSVARHIESELTRVGTPERAAGEKQYLKSDLSFLGTTVGDTRKVTQASLKEAADTGDLTHDDIVALVLTLWSRPIFECRLAATLALERRSDLLDLDDLELLERLIRESRTWALVDVLAGSVVGDLAVRADTGPALDRWSRDDDFWVRRSSLLAEIRPLKNGMAFAPFADRADGMLEEKEFFIRKAIGWVLREASKTRPDEVFAWIAPRTDRASGVTIREVVKYLEESRRTQLMDAYREHRPAVAGRGDRDS